MRIKKLAIFDLNEFLYIKHKQCWYDQDINNKNFNDIIQFMANNKPTIKNLYTVAKSVMENTTTEFEINYNETEFILHTMNYINDTCVNITFMKG